MCFHFNSVCSYLPLNALAAQMLLKAFPYRSHIPIARKNILHLRKNKVSETLSTSSNATVLLICKQSLQVACKYASPHVWQDSMHVKPKSGYELQEIPDQAWEETLLEK